MTYLVTAKKRTGADGFLRAGEFWPDTGRVVDVVPPEVLSDRMFEIVEIPAIPTVAVEVPASNESLAPPTQTEPGSATAVVERGPPSPSKTQRRPGRPRKPVALGSKVK